MWCWLLLSVCLCSSSTSATTKTVLITASDEKLRDPDGYNAIAALHRMMDDDHSGSIDRFESADFLKEDLKIGGSDRARREKAFHHNDDAITIDDLWESWFERDERSWNTDELTQWLISAVNLPQYADLLKQHQITGVALPRIAEQNSSYLSNVLGIKNGVHRHKLQLKALDVVLFGYRDGSSRLKDIALAILVIVLTLVLVIFKKHKARSKTEMGQLSEQLSQLKNMENEFQGIQERFEEERKRKQSMGDSTLKDSNTDVESLRLQLIETQQRLQQWEGGLFSSAQGLAPLALQPLLRRTCEVELNLAAAQRAECVAEMHDAIEMVDRLRKKQTSLVSSLRLATGASAASATDHIDKRIFGLKSRMERIMVSMEEGQQRWLEIESLCGFTIISSSPISMPMKTGPPSVASLDSPSMPRNVAVASSQRPMAMTNSTSMAMTNSTSMAMTNSTSAVDPVRLPSHPSETSSQRPISITNSTSIANPVRLPSHPSETDSINSKTSDRQSMNAMDLSSQSTASPSHSTAAPPLEVTRTVLSATSKKPSFSNLFRKK